ncbi:MAG: FtsX-like permease family protein [Bacteroidota bacterium]
MQKSLKKADKSFYRLIFEKDNKQTLDVANFIANRIAFNRQKSFSRFIIRLSVTATIISVTAMIVTLALVNGFQQTISQKIFSFWGHIRVVDKQPMRSAIAEETPIQKNDTVFNDIKKSAQVAGVNPFATRYAMLKSKEEIDGVLIKGLDTAYDYNHLKRFMQEGRWIQFNDTSYSREIILSAHTANQLKLKLNDRVFIYFIRPDGTLRPDRLTIVGIYKTGILEYDQTFAIGDLKLIQRLNGWEADEIGGYEIFLKDFTKMDQASVDLYNLNSFPQTWDTKTIRQLYPNTFDWLQMQNVTRNVLIGFMITVAVINLITCLIILVLERVRMIGVLKAIGAGDWTIQKIFLQHSLFITLTGIVLGTALALALLWLQQSTGFIKLNEEAYYMSTAAVYINWWQVAAVCIGTLVVCIIVLMIPSVIVKRIQPVKAIRFS